jgi:hypothetical protein
VISKVIPVRNRICTKQVSFFYQKESAVAEVAAGRIRPSMGYLEQAEAAGVVL